MSVDLSSARVTRYENFTGGMNQSSGFSKSKRNQVSDLINMTVEPTGELRVRRGTKLYHQKTSGMDLEVKNLIPFVTSSGTRRMIAYSGIEGASDMLYSVDMDGNQTTFSYKFPSDDGHIRGVQYKDVLFLGTEKASGAFYFDGSAFASYAGVGVDGVVPTEDLFGISSALVSSYDPDETRELEPGEYIYRFTFDLSLGGVFIGETAPLASVPWGSFGQWGPLDPHYTSQQVGIGVSGYGVSITKSAIDPGPWLNSVSAINIYRSPKMPATTTSAKRAVETNLYKLATINISTYNSASSGDILYFDVGGVPLGEQIRYDVISMPQFRFIESMKSRVWIGRVKWQTNSLFGPIRDNDKPNDVMFSAFRTTNPEPYVFSNSSAITIQPQHAGGLTGLKSFYDQYLMAFTEEGVTAIVVGDRDLLEGVPDISLQEISRVGCIAPETIVAFDGVIAWMAPDGPHYFDGNKTSDLNIRELYTNLENIPEASKKNMRAGYNHRTKEYWLAHTLPDYGGTYRYIVSAFGTKTGSWTQHLMPMGFGSMAHIYDPDRGLREFIGMDYPTAATNDSCSIYELNSGYSDRDGSSYNWAVETILDDFGIPGAKKNVLAVGVITTSETDITVQFKADGETRYQRTVSSIAGSTELIWEDDGSATDYNWDAFDWATDSFGEFGGQSREIIVRADGTVFGNTFSFRISGTQKGGPLPVISAITVYFATRRGV